MLNSFFSDYDNDLEAQAILPVVGIKQFPNPVKKPQCVTQMVV